MKIDMRGMRLGMGEWVHPNVVSVSLKGGGSFKGEGGVSFKVLVYGSFKVSVVVSFKVVESVSFKLGVGVGVGCCVALIWIGERVRWTGGARLFRVYVGYCCPGVG